MSLVNTKQQSRLKYFHSLMSIPLVFELAILSFCTIASASHVSRAEGTATTLSLNQYFQVGMYLRFPCVHWHLQWDHSVTTLRLFTHWPLPPVCADGTAATLFTLWHWAFSLQHLHADVDAGTLFTRPLVFFWEACISIEDPLTRPDPVHP
jgi:hypothetical protein